MIRAEFFRSTGGMLSGFHITGHSGMSEYGEDVLCAFVSSAAYMTANTVTDVICADAEASAKDGDMLLTVSERDRPKCQIILEGLMLHLNETEKQYPDNLKVILTEV